MVAMSDSDDSLSVKTKDSIEELASNVSRSPRSQQIGSLKDWTGIALPWFFRGALDEIGTHQENPI